MKIKRVYYLSIILLAFVSSAKDRYGVLIDDAGNTIPPNSVATPQQVTELNTRVTNMQITSLLLQNRALSCEEKVRTYATNRLITSTCYVQSIGGIPYNPDLQTVTIRSIDVTSDSVTIKATLAVSPLIPPTLDWRFKINEGGWDKLAVTANEISLEVGWMNDSAKAYSFTFSKPSGSSCFFRVVDNSTGSSGSGLYWLVFGAIAVDGQIGYSGPIGDHLSKGGIIVKPEPLGGI